MPFKPVIALADVEELRDLNPDQADVEPQLSYAKVSSRELDSIQLPFIF